MDETLKKLQERLGITVKDEVRLRQALTHKSAAAENAQESNERLEFLGDSIVGLIVSEQLFRSHPEYSEGDLAKSKAYIVSELVFAEAARAIGLEECIRVSTSEEAAGGKRRRSILADAFEALMAAIYLDCGLRTARRVILKSLKLAMSEVATDEHRRDYKSALQERTQAIWHHAPRYDIAGEEGRDHEKNLRRRGANCRYYTGNGARRQQKRGGAGGSAGRTGKTCRRRFRVTAKNQVKCPTVCERYRVLDQNRQHTVYAEYLFKNKSRFSHDGMKSFAVEPAAVCASHKIRSEPTGHAC